MDHENILAGVTYIRADSVLLATDLGLEPRWTYGRGVVRCRLYAPDGAVAAFGEARRQGEPYEAELSALTEAIDHYFALVGHDDPPRYSDFWPIERE